MTDTLSRMFDDQGDFNALFFDNDKLTQADRERLTMVFAASLQKEIGSLLEGVNFRQHRLIDKQPELSKILHESVDAWRYILAIMNLWEISADDFAEAFADRDLFLRLRHLKESVPWGGQPVLVVDMDDVVTPFRRDCTRWVQENFPGQVDETNKSYYSISQELYKAYIDARQLKHQGSIPEWIEVVNKLHDQGVWIHLLTARPKENLTVKYDTYAWLKKSGLKFDRVSFSSEKYLWVARTDYYKQGKLIGAVDDSPKHAMEYASHGVTCFVPINVHNEDMAEQDNVVMCHYPGDLRSRVERIVNKMNRAS